MPLPSHPSDPRTLRSRLARALRRVRRGVLVRRRWLAAVCAGVAVAAGLEANSVPPPPTEEVLTAARDLPGGRVLRPNDLRIVRVAPQTVPAGVEPDPVGRMLASPLRRGESITDVRLVGKGLLDGHRGLTAVPVRIPDPAVVDLLRVGDSVDLIGTDPQGGGTRTVAGDVVVLAVPPTDPESSGIGLSGALVVLGTVPADAEKVADAAVQEFLSIAFSA
ncbi:MAG: SAF domain-containing protein [Nocardioides sp.]